uniref:Band 7 domain-containing protein n=1 Tax=Calcidiscus leptoporus TaxID=127549 RepID=A0A7S0NYA0_9EUKA
MMYVPFITKATKRKGTQLDDLSYIVVKNELTGLEFTVAGPQLYFLNPHEVASERKRKIVLEKHEYVRLLDATSGQQRLIKGPAKVVPDPFESIVNGRQQPAVRLSKLQYVVVTDSLTGNRRVVTGPQLFFPGTYETVGDISEAVELSKLQYVQVTETLTGAKRVVSGPTLFFPDAYETVGDISQAYEVRKHQYLKLLDQTTGTLRVERGEATVFPRAHEEAAEGGVKDAVNVDDETAVLVLSKASGQQRLITTKGLFFPEALEEIVEVRRLVRVQPHEVAIVRDNFGAFHFHSGNASGAGNGTAFFLPPHCELVTMYWSSATSKEDAEQHIVRNAKQVAYKVPMSKIDLRAQYAFFEYKVRTSDNVELLLEGTIFWQVADVPRMIERTGDPKGDVWYHARSALIQAVSAVTLEQFMASFNSIVSKAAETDVAFYEGRGVRLHGLEVVRFECVDGKTAGVLQEIIQETTNRINRLQKQKSENEVEAERLHSQIEIERQRKQLIEARTANEKLQASVEGESEGTRLAQNTMAFLNMLNVSVPDDATRLQLLKFFTEQQTLTTQTEHLSKGNASLFLTPQDMQLRLQMPSD